MSETTTKGALPSRAVRVTLYEDRAEVVRRAEATLGAGTQWIAVGGVTALLDDRSVQAKVDGEVARVLAARVVRRVIHQPEAGREELEALELECRSARARLDDAQRAAERAAHGRRRHEASLAQLHRALAEVPHGASGPALETWRRAHAAVSRAAAESVEAASAARFAVEDAEEAAQRAEARLALARAQKPRCEARVEVQLEARTPGSAGIELSYRTPCAAWRPEHLARLGVDGADERAGRVAITTWATAWQCTGESWEGVEACFSTARPAREAKPPLLADDVLVARRKTEEERKTIVVESREQAIATSGLAPGARKVDEMPGVDDGGLPLSFRPTAPVTLPSDGEPYRIEIGRVELKARVGRVLMPERAPVAHLRATATLEDAVPLLAGPMRVARGAGLVGRARVDFVAPGEPFALGFGPDDALRVRREASDRRDQVPLVGTQKIERTVRLYLSNLSDTPRTVEITERVPVSELAEVEVEVKAAPGFEADRDGFLRAEVSVAGGATQELELRYEVRAKSNVALPF